MLELFAVLLQARTREGAPLSAETIRVLMMLWTRVPEDWLLGCVEGREPPPQVPGLAETLVGSSEPAELRRVQRALKVLREEAWILASAGLRRRTHVQLLTPQAREQHLRNSQLLHSVKTQSPRARPCRDVTGDVVDVTGDVVDVTGDVADVTGDVEPRSEFLIGLINNYGERGVNARAQGARGTAHAGRARDWVALARDLHARAPRVPGAARIPATLDAAVHLARQLEGGLDVHLAVTLLADAPAIVDAGLQEPRWYTAELWRGERLSRWLSAQAQLHQRRELAPQVVNGDQPLERRSAAAKAFGLVDDAAALAFVAGRRAEVEATGRAWTLDACDEAFEQFHRERLGDGLARGRAMLAQLRRERDEVTGRTT